MPGKDPRPPTPCSRCGGSKAIQTTQRDSKGKLKIVTRICPVCKGTGKK